MTVLNHQEIHYYCFDPSWLANNEPLIVDCAANNIKGASYDLRLGSQFYIYNDLGNDIQTRFEVLHLKETQQIIIPPGEVCYAISREALNMPKNLCANVSLPLGLVLEGLMLSKQPPIDPGYTGGIICMLHNLSNSYVYLKANSKILTVEFSKLSSDTNRPYNGSYQGKVSLDLYLNKPITSGINALRKQLTAISTRITNSFPIILTILSIAVAFMVFYLTFTNSSLNNEKDQIQIIDHYQQDQVLRVKLPDGKIVNVPYQAEDAIGSE